MLRTFYMMMVLSISFTVSYSQEKFKRDISLEEAVLRGSKYSPESMPGLKWLGNSDRLVKNSKDRMSVLVSEANFNAWDTLFSIKNINDHFKLKLKYIPGYSFLNDSCILFSSGQKYFMYNFISYNGKIFASEPSTGENIDFCRQTGNFAYTISNNLFIRLKTGDSVQITFFDDKNIVAGQSIARNEFGIHKGTFWSNDGSKLAFYQKDEGDVTDYPLIDLMTTPASLIPTKYPMAGMKSEIPSAGIYDLITGKITYLKTSTEEPDHYLTNLSWDPTGKYIYLVEINRAQNHFDFNQYDSETGELVATLFEEKNSRYVEPVDEAWFIPGRKGEFLWFSVRDGFRHLYRYNTEGYLLNQVTRGNFSVNSILGTDKSGKNLYISASDELGLNDELYIVSLEKGDMKKLSNEAGVHTYLPSKSGKYIIDTYSNMTTPRVINVINNKGKNLNNLLISANPLDSLKIGKTEIINITGADGKTILNGRLIKPYDFDPAKKYKVFVYVYGGPHMQMVRNGWLGQSSLWMYSLANKGYLVFVLDNRGSENRGFEFESVIHRNLGETEMEDQMKGVGYIKKLSYADTTKMAIHGWSYGGFLTTSLMLRKPGTFKVGVAGGPVINWKWYEVMYGERYMDMPEENPEGYEKTSLLNYASDLEGNLLIINGSIDPVVVPQHSLAMLKKFIEAGKQVDYFVYPMHEHNVFGQDRYHLMQKIINYVDEKLR
ncbi:MAG: DPP IV N-terminal domain-containing protein [Deltaproteobacteria bacterium]